MKTTQIIKKILTESFPGVAFSVRGDSSSGCSSISIRYTDGPLGSEVDAIAKVFEHGSFNGMEDIYEYDGAALVLAGEEVRKVKYCIPHRDESDGVRAERKVDLAERFAEIAAGPYLEWSRDYERAVDQHRREQFGEQKALPSSTFEALTVVPRGADLQEAKDRSRALMEAKALRDKERKEISRHVPDKPATKLRSTLSL